ncbi:MAG: 50S ribosomal protein L37ae [Fervidicoccaceae archaeon]|jgi:large subunit ribosomal protein L37Ae|uniref:Large ribosomal subunit protein eL43 n=1 Tax=Fervidicoccus fontis TaxID=683846 RepID=A0A7C2YH89_9CREN|nr:MAG: 50S ribosomal protein L37ae [Fervidicoccus sp.]HEU97617.1 50S ribosomal protein L37ae [Fervidicoccus fontis]
MGRTKLVGIAGKFGARYGSTLRKQYKEIMEKRYAEHVCPFCGISGKVKRISTGIWKCEKCGTTWAGASYLPRSGMNKLFPKVVQK